MEKPTTYSYTISYEPMTDNMSSELVESMEKAQAIALKGKDQGLKQLRKLSKKHPGHPQFGNYLTVWYSVRGNVKKAREVNRQILQKHPDYLFAKVNLAHEYLDRDQPEKVVELLGDAIEIKQIYPEKEKFHITEIASLLKLAIAYFIKTKDLQEAKTRLDMLDELDWVDREEIEEYEITLMQAKMAELPFFNRKESPFSVNTNPQPQTTKTEPPVFHHREVAELY